MKYSAILLAFALGVAAIPQDQPSTITSAPASPSTTQSATEICLAKCDPSDVTCQARCVGVARPNESQIVETTECAAKCDQGDGSPEATEKYADCQQACFAKYFPSSQTLTGEGGKPSDPASNPSGTASGANPTGAENGTETGSQPQSTGAASMNSIHFAGAGLAGLALAVFGL